MREQRDSKSDKSDNFTEILTPKFTEILTPKFTEIDFNCANHGPVKAKIMDFNGARMMPRCPQCQHQEAQKEMQLKDEEDKKRGAESRKRAIEGLIQNADIPLRFKEHSFATYAERSPEHAKKKQMCLDYAENFIEKLKKGTSVILSGTTGTGKTHLACAIANYIIAEHCKSAAFISVLNAVRRVKETYRKGSEQTEREAIKSFLAPDLLILDEVGVQFGSETEKMIIFEIINQRYENLKPTILISNLNFDNLKLFIGDRIADRMKENGGVFIPFDFESYRGKKQVRKDIDS